MGKKTQQEGVENTPPPPSSKGAQSSKGEQSEAWNPSETSTSSAASAPASTNFNAAPAPSGGQFEQQTFDADLYQGLRILVPVDVQAYVVDPQSPRDDKSLTKPLEDSMGIHGTGPQSNANQAPKAQPDGIHLHWAMPDALMIGAEKDGLDPEADLKLKETHDFPALPDRWVVVRQWRENPTSIAWKSKSWVIDSNTKTVSDLQKWVSPGPSQSLMTAVDDGDSNTDEDITWTATYDSSHGRFTFHDLPEAGVKGPLNYLVAGWYSTPSQDPLHCSPTRSRGEWKAVMKHLGWSIPESEVLQMVASMGDGTYFTGNLGGDS